MKPNSRSIKSPLGPRCSHGLTAYPPATSSTGWWPDTPTSRRRTIEGPTTQFSAKRWQKYFNSAGTKSFMFKEEATSTSDLRYQIIIDVQTWRYKREQTGSYIKRGSTYLASCCLNHDCQRCLHNVECANTWKHLTHLNNYIGITKFRRHSMLKRWWNQVCLI